MTKTTQLLQIDDVVSIYRHGVFYGYDFVTHVTNKFATTSRKFRLRREIDEYQDVEFTASAQNSGYMARWAHNRTKKSIEELNKNLLEKRKKRLIRVINKTEDLTRICEFHSSTISLEE